MTDAFPIYTPVEVVAPTVRSEPGLRMVARPPEEPVERYAAAFLVGYDNPNTRRSYEQHLREWFAWCEEIGLDPMAARRSHFELFMRTKESDGNSRSTVARKHSTLVMFYAWLVDDDYLDKNPAKAAKRPKVTDTQSRDWLTGVELARWLKGAELEGGYTYALACLLGYNGLRIAEVCQANIADIGRERHNWTLRVLGKGSKVRIAALNGPTKWALDEAHDGRTFGPLILNSRGDRLARDSAARTVRRLTKQAGIKNKNITPHSLRHSSITALHDAGADPRAVMQFAGHAKLATTQLYDHKRTTLDDAGSYRLAGYVAERADW